MKILTMMLVMFFAMSLNVAPVMADSDRGKSYQDKRDKDDRSNDRRKRDDQSSDDSSSDDRSSDSRSKERDGSDKRSHKDDRGTNIADRPLDSGWWPF